MASITFQTSQNIELEFPVATPRDRVVAGLLDLLVRLAYALSAGYIAGGMMAGGMQLGSFLLSALTLPLTFYPLLAEMWAGGQTLGKRLVGIRVVRLDGSAPSHGALLLRWLLRPDFYITLPILRGEGAYDQIYLLAYVLYMLVAHLPALVFIAITPKGQRLADLLAGTAVVRLKLATGFEESIFRDTDADHVVQFPQIRALSDKDMAILKEVLDAGLRSDNDDLLARLAARVHEVAGIETRLAPRQFLEAVLADYNHLYGQ